MVSNFFVYGTLKRGQSRHHLWPAAPRAVVPAWTYGHLYDGADYPAMTAGNDQVIGELWSFDAAAVPGVIQRLDQIECTNQPGQPDLYVRIIAPVYRMEPELRINEELCANAYLYLYGTNPQESGLTRMFGAPVEWPKTSSGRPSTHEESTTD